MPKGYRSPLVAIVFSASEDFCRISEACRGEYIEISSISGALFVLKLKRAHGMRVALIAFLSGILASGCVQTPHHEGGGEMEHSAESCPGEKHSVDSEGLSSIISNKGLKSFQRKYKDASENKAFAQSSSGEWAWRSNKTTKSNAILSALVACQVENASSEKCYPCEVINVNGVWR